MLRSVNAGNPSLPRSLRAAEARAQLAPAAKSGPVRAGAGVDPTAGVFGRMVRQADELLAGPWRQVADKAGFRTMLPIGACGLPSAGSWNSPGMTRGEGVFEGIPVDRAVDTMLRQAIDNNKSWDRTFTSMEKVKTVREDEVIFRYRSTPPGKIFATRDMVYYEAFHKDPATGVVNCVSVSLPEFEREFPKAKGDVRAHIEFILRRFTPIDGGRSTKYETLQRVDLGGNMPECIATLGLLSALRSEFVGSRARMADRT